MSKSVKKSTKTLPYQRGSSDVSDLKKMLGSFGKAGSNHLVSLREKVQPTFGWKNVWIMSLGTKLRVTVDYCFEEGKRNEPIKFVLQLRNWYQNIYSEEEEFLPSSYGVSIRSKEMTFIQNLLSTDFTNGIHTRAMASRSLQHGINFTCVPLVKVQVFGFQKVPWKSF